MRCFNENSYMGPCGPNYGTDSDVMMDVADLMNSYYGQNPRTFNPMLVEKHYTRFNEFYGTKLAPKIDWTKMEEAYSEMNEGEYEFTSAHEFETFWNRFAI
jgi:hypothetical protein